MTVRPLSQRLEATFKVDIFCCGLDKIKFIYACRILENQLVFHVSTISGFLACGPPILATPVSAR